MFSVSIKAAESRLAVFFLSLAIIFCALATPKPILAESKGNQDAIPAKSYVLDGHVYHDAGLLWNHVTNWGLVGSCPTLMTSFSEAPSARWPGQDGVDHLWAGGLWVGGRVLGETLVSTGGYSPEFAPTMAALDTIYPSFQGMAGGNRYPWPLADDDGDFAEDEDPLDGMDNDLDGRVDEDFAAASDQSFRCAYQDTAALIQETNPDHTPLNLQVIQETFQWDRPTLEDAIGYQFTVQNIGVVAIEDVCLGFYADFDIPAVEGEAEDDRAHAWNGMILTESGIWVPVSLAYMYDSDATGGSGYAGVVFCEPETADHTVQIFAGNAAFNDGGDPTNDNERYQLLSSSSWDYGATSAGDYRVLVSRISHQQLAPGESMVLRVGLAVETGLEELLYSAAEMVLAAYGQPFDRDGLPENGEEFQVHWLPWEDVPSPAPGSDEVPGRTIDLNVHPNPFNPRLVIDLDRQDGPVRVAIFDVRGRLIRQMEASDTSRLEWDGKDQAGRNAPSGVYRVQARQGKWSAEKRVTLVR
jgi:hypothetical protein